VVTGTRGQVARALVERAPALAAEVVACGRPQLDLLKVTTIEPALRAARPDIVVSAAAYTAVDRAESEPELAHAINANGAEAVAARDLDWPYREDDAPLARFAPTPQAIPRASENRMRS
jgi:dTDP-4-dehydrorhamnose reductase